MLCLNQPKISIKNAEKETSTADDVQLPSTAISSESSIFRTIAIASNKNVE